MTTPRRLLHGFLAVPLALWILVPGASGQSNNLQALLQALHQHAFDGGQYEGTFTPTSQQMLQRVASGTIQQLAAASNALASNPNNVTALVTRGAISLSVASKSPYGVYWLHFAALDLERALKLDPNNFYAAHNYAQACLQQGDASPAQPVMHLAVYWFTKAIALRPNSARSYMGRGWAYLMLSDGAHAQADFRKTLQLDPSLRNQLVTEAKAILEKKCERSGADAMLKRMGAYVVNRNARTANQCAAIKGYWTNSECRISTAMAPGPLMLGPADAATGNAGLAELAHACHGNPNASDYKYNKRAGGVFVR